MFKGVFRLGLRAAGHPQVHVVVDVCSGDNTVGYTETGVARAGARGRGVSGAPARAAREERDAQAEDYTFS